LTWLKRLFKSNKIKSDINKMEKEEKSSYDQIKNKETINKDIKDTKKPYKI
jgi:hypothetical protein